MKTSDKTGVFLLKPYRHLVPFADSVDAFPNLHTDHRHFSMPETSIKEKQQSS